MKLALAMALCLSLVCQVEPAAAQVPFNACLDRHGEVIPGIPDNTIPYAGIATKQAGRPVILWNQKENRHLSQTEQIFIYLHECAHHLLGHLYRSAYGPEVELEADCWAIQLMVDGGMIKPRHLEVLERSRRHVRADATHLGGEAHIKSLTQCLEMRTDPRAWASALDTLIRAAQDSFASSSGRVLDSTSPGSPVYEASVGTPGTYDCEIAGGVLRCIVFASRKPGPARERFAQLMKIVRGWLPVGWSSMNQVPAAEGQETFLAQDGMTGTLLTLVLHGQRVYFLVRREPV